MTIIVTLQSPQLLLYLSKVLCLMRKEGVICHMSSLWCINPPFYTHLINCPPYWLHNNNINPSVRSWRVTSWRSTSSWRWDVWAPPPRTSPRRWCGWRTVTRGPSSWTCSMLQVTNYLDYTCHWLNPLSCPCLLVLLTGTFTCSAGFLKAHPGDSLTVFWILLQLSNNCIYIDMWLVRAFSYLKEALIGWNSVEMKTFVDSGCLRTGVEKPCV